MYEKKYKKKANVTTTITMIIIIGIKNNNVAIDYVYFAIYINLY